MNPPVERDTADHRDQAPTLDIQPVVQAVFAGRWWIAGGVIVGLVAGLVLWNISGVQYEAVATVAVNQPRSAPAGITATPTANYRALLENYSVVASVVKETGLDAGPRPIGPEQFMRRVLFVDEIRGTNLIRITIRLGDPALAAKVAQAVATRAVELSRRINEEEGSSLRDRLQGQMQEALTRFKNAEQQLIAFKRSSDIDVRRADLASLVKQRKALVGVDVDLSSQEGRVVAAERERSLRPPTNTFARTFADSPALTEAARAQAGGDAKSLMGLGLKTEEANKTYEALDKEVALARTKIAQLQRQRQQILDSSSQFKNAGKLADLYELEIALAGLDADRLLARKVYEDVALRYEQAKVVVTSGSAQLQIVDAAVALPTPLSWPWAVGLLLGGVIGGAVPVCVILAGILARHLGASLIRASRV